MGRASPGAPAGLAARRVGSHSAAARRSVRDRCDPFAPAAARGVGLGRGVGLAAGRARAPGPPGAGLEAQGGAALEARAEAVVLPAERPVLPAGRPGRVASAARPAPKPAPAITSGRSPEPRSKQSPMNACHPSEVVKYSGPRPMAKIYHTTAMLAEVSLVNRLMPDDHAPSSLRNKIAASALGRNAAPYRQHPIWSSRGIRKEVRRSENR